MADSKCLYAATVVISYHQHLETSLLYPGKKSHGLFHCYIYDELKVFVYVLQKDLMPM